MNPTWSRQASRVVNSAEMRQRPIEDQRKFVEAAGQVESADELPEPWRALALSIIPF